jgi:two-component system, chemotaxis family, sensor kinase CheA
MIEQKYKKLFLAEADEKISELNNALLGLEKKPGNKEQANQAMRAAHTLKSSAAAMEYMQISHLAHAMEDFFEQVRSQSQTLAPEIINILFVTVDTLSNSLVNIKKGKEEIDTQELVEKLRGISDLRFKISDLEDKTNQQSTINNRQSNGMFAPIESIKVDVESLDKLMNLTEELLVNNMRLNEIVRKVGNTQSNSHDEKKKNLPDFSLSPEKNDYPSRRWLTEADRLPVTHSLDNDVLKSVTESQNRLLSDLQYTVTQARMLPLGQIFERFPRVVRDLAKEENKQIEFTLEGQDIELDRTVIDRISEPLIHLLRNAIDHGITDRGTIQLSAKRERERVVIEVSNTGSGIEWGKVVEAAVKRGVISEAKGKDLRSTIDDLDLKKNIENQKSEIVNLLFHPSLSTKEKVTETSGRGVGLSIVKGVIEALGGTVAVESPIQLRGSTRRSSTRINTQISDRSAAEERSDDQDQRGISVGGTLFRLSLPLTLAIIQALLVRAGNQNFALPFSQVDRSVRVPIKNIKKAFDQEVAVVEKEDIPMVRLDKIFGLEHKGGVFFTEEEMQEKKHVAELMVIAKKENMPAVGLVIDELIAEQEVVVKPLKGVLKQSKGFAGVTLLGDGRPALILDVATLV